MNVYLVYGLVAIIALALGALISYLLLKSNADKANLHNSLLQQQLDEFKNNLTKEQAKVNELSTLLAGAEKDIAHLHEKNSIQAKETTSLQEKLTTEFENIANKILHTNSTKFSEQSRENITHLLNPLKEKIADFEKKVEQSNTQNIDIHASLKHQINSLKELNLQMSKEALNLTKALKGDSKKQGNWGELVLERVLEKSGLEKGREYDVQTSFTTEEGKRVIPDVIIHLPNNKKMIVDSKVSLTAYERYVNEDDDEIQKEKFLKLHIDSIQKHIDDLSNMNYHDLYKIESPDFVLMFIPIEPAFAVAVNTDEKLYNKAFDKNIVIVTPSTLLATLRTIDTMWTNDKQQKNALQIAIQAGSLYDKFEGLTQDLIRVGKRIQETDTEYKKAMNKLVDGRGNIISKIENLKKLGAKANKSLPNSLLERADEENE